MRKLSIEQLVQKGVSTKMHKGETLLLVSSLKKKSKGVNFHDSDILEIEEENYIRLTDCEFPEKSSEKKIADIEVKGAKVVKAEK